MSGKGWWQLQHKLGGGMSHSRAGTSTDGTGIHETGAGGTPGAGQGCHAKEPEQEAPSTPVTPALSSSPSPCLCELHAHLFPPSSSSTLAPGTALQWLELNCCLTPRQGLGSATLPPVPSPRVKSPPWIMKSLITRWNLLPLKPNPFWGCGGRTRSEAKGQTRALWPQPCPRAPSRGR